MLSINYVKSSTHSMIEWLHLTTWKSACASLAKHWDTLPRVCLFVSVYLHLEQEKIHSDLYHQSISKRHEFDSCIVLCRIEFRFFVSAHRQTRRVPKLFLGRCNSIFICVFLVFLIRSLESLSSRCCETPVLSQWVIISCWMDFEIELK